MKKTEDDGADLKVGDTVWAKFTVHQVSAPGDVRCVYHPRPGHTAYAESSINKIFLWRESDMKRPAEELEFREACLQILFDAVRDLRSERGVEIKRHHNDLVDLKDIYREFGPR